MVLTPLENTIAWLSIFGSIGLSVLIFHLIKKPFFERYNQFSQNKKSAFLASLLGLPVFALYIFPYAIGDLKGTASLFTNIGIVFIFSAIALTLNLEVGFLGLPNFGKVAFMAISGYSYYFAFDWMFTETKSTTTSIIFGMVVAIIITGIAGVLLTLPSLKLKEDYFAIVTIVAGEIIRMLINNQRELGGASGFKVFNPFFVQFDSNLQIERILPDSNVFALIGLYILLVGLRAFSIYRDQIKHLDKKRSIQNTIDKSVTFSLFLGMMFSLLNLIQTFGEPSISLDIFVLLFPFSLVLLGAIEKNFEYGLIVNGIISLVAFLISFSIFVYWMTVTTSEYPYWYSMISAYYVMAIVYLIIRELITSPFGRTIRAIREDDTSATSVGKSLFMYRLKGLVISSALTGFAGVLFAYSLFTITPDAYLPIITFNLYIMVIIGGTANNKGVIYGTALIQLLNVSASRLISYKEIFPWYPWTAENPQVVDPTNIAQISIGLLLIIFLVFSPKGIFPEKQQNNQKYFDYLYLLEEDEEKLGKNAFVQTLMKLTKSKLPSGDAILELSGESSEVAPGEYIFDAEEVHKNFGGVKALNGATVMVEKGKLTSLIGPNGSGKSTFFNVVSGFLDNEGDAGKVRFKKVDISDEVPEVISHMGMVRTFQHTRNFPKLSVLENMLVSPQDQVGESVIWSVLGKPLWQRQEARYVKRAMHILKFLEIDHVADHLADELSGGQQKLLAIGRLLMTQPSLLLLDEPVAGVNPTLANKIFDRIIDLKNSQGIDVLLIEHNMDVVMSFSDEIFVLADGKVIAQGDSKHIQENKTVLDAYLGESPDEA